jgi:hypothetical protein
MYQIGHCKLLKIISYFENNNVMIIISGCSSVKSSKTITWPYHRVRANNLNPISADEKGHKPDLISLYDEAKTVQASWDVISRMICQNKLMCAVSG